MIIICTLALMLNGSPVYKEVEGRPIQLRGDYWIIDFSKTLKRYPQYKVEKQVQVINNNRCLIK